jgi:hypothetical protein
MTIEFDCEGCGVQVFAFGIDAAPETQMCAVCEWMCEHLDPLEMMTIRQARGDMAECNEHFRRTREGTTR